MTYARGSWVGSIEMYEKKMLIKIFFFRTSWLRCLQFHFKQLGPDILENISVVSYEITIAQSAFCPKSSDYMELILSGNS